MAGRARAEEAGITLVTLNTRALEDAQPLRARPSVLTRDAQTLIDIDSAVRAGPTQRTLAHVTANQVLALTTVFARFRQ
jgi:hypothetical protein